MQQEIFKKGLRAWFPMLFMAIANGTLRDLVYAKYLGKLAAHQLSTLSLIFILGLYIRWLMRQKMSVTSKQALFLGFYWATLTLFFEFSAGYLSGKSIAELLFDYQIQNGRIWILIPVWLCLAPYLFCQKNLKSNQSINF